MEEYELDTTLSDIRSDTDGLNIWLFALYSGIILHTSKTKQKRATNKNTTKKLSLCQKPGKSKKMDMIQDSRHNWKNNLINLPTL